MEASDTESVIGELLAALELPGAVNAGLARHVSSQLRTVLDFSHRGSLVEAFEAIAAALRPELDVLGMMDQLVGAATAHTHAVDAGIVLADADGRLHIVASTHERAADVEETQLGSREGPCWDSFRGGHIIDVPDISDSDGWPAFTDAALSNGFRSAHATPLQFQGHTIGALNLFSDRPGPFPPIESALARTLADTAVLGLIHHRDQQQPQEADDMFGYLLESRQMLEQAKDWIAGHNKISEDAAYRLLRKHSRGSDTRLSDTAQHVLAGQLVL